MDRNADLISYLRSKLGTDDRAEVKLDTQWKDFNFDIIIDDKEHGKMLLIEIRPRAGLNDLARINLYKDYLKDGSGSRGEPCFFLVTKSMSDRLWDVAKKLDIEVLTVPHGIGLSRGTERGTPSKIKITSEKSWRVVSGLIRSRSSSIRSLSIAQGVSYGWAHSTVNDLILHGIAKRSGNMVYLSDTDKLLNGVAWERPTPSLVVKELVLPSKDVFVAAGELTETLDDLKVNHAFTSYMAGTQYTGLSVRHDSIQMYLNNEDMSSLDELIAPSEQDAGIKLQVMVPDRELFNEARLIGNIRVVSPSQALLDLAGTGYKAKDLTKALVDIYGQL